jgi:pantothenate kinase-related protein Tda10
MALVYSETGERVRGIDGNRLTIVIYGPQGSGKTRMQQLLKWLLIHTFPGITIKTNQQLYVAHDEDD